VCKWQTTLRSVARAFDGDLYVLETGGFYQADHCVVGLIKHMPGFRKVLLCQARHIGFQARPSDDA